ncbi:unnamed protein product [Microthlaspi erraticum]|uniref:DUF223 domain-containing protein n=1 Tax=Microthlaspi erraticum TaxID=1685480 RepID=A0A6D2JVE9_9BRAS|nr:unnamed protein product [Microthlaspi erraticum]
MELILVDEKRDRIQASGTTHPYKISLLFNTYLKPSSGNIPNVSRFNFCSFGDIESQCDVFIDILGQVVSMSDIRVPGTKKNFRNWSYKVVKLTKEDAIIARFKDILGLMESTLSELPLVSSKSSGFQMDNTSSEAVNII